MKKFVNERCSLFFYSYDYSESKFAFIDWNFIIFEISLPELPWLSDLRAKIDFFVFVNPRDGLLDRLKLLGLYSISIEMSEFYF